MTQLLDFLKRRSTLYHFGGWMIFIAYEVSFVYLIGSVRSGINIWSGFVTPYLINIALFYFHALVVLDLVFGKKKSQYLLFILLLLLEMMLYLFVMLLNNWLFSEESKSLPAYMAETDPGIFIRQIWRGLYFVLFSTGLWFTLRYFDNLKRLQESEKRSIIQQQERQRIQLDLVSSQNAFLQAQINPHLLFNTLNFIHNKVRSSSPAAAGAIITLAEMMRYSLTGITADGKVLLTSEVEQIENLIRINEFRFDSKQNIHLATDKQSYEGTRIIPLLLLPFVENIFKYAELMDADQPAEVRLEVKNNALYFQTYNRKRNPVNFHSQKIGIDNVRKRLNSHYPGNYQLDVKNDEAFFTVMLSINL